jgi:protein-disulfide isomerase
MMIRIIVLLSLVAVTASGCAEDSTADGAVARLTTRGAGELLSSAPPVAPLAPGIAALSRPAPNAPGTDEVDPDDMGADFGNPDAPVRIMEFFDYGCGFCRQFHAETLPSLMDEYIDEGKVLWKSVPFVIGNWANSVPASLSAECANDQGRYADMTELLFSRQSDWKQGSEPEAVLEGFAEELGLDMDRYRSCFSGDEFLWRVQTHTTMARQLGVRSTPTFFLIGYGPFSGALPLDVFRNVIDTVLVQEAANSP